MRLRIQHTTEYRYEEKVGFTLQQLYFHPRVSHNIQVEKFDLAVLPICPIRWLRDAYDNSLAIAQIQDESTQLVIHSESIVELKDLNPFDFLLERRAVSWPFQYSPEEKQLLSPFLTPLSDCKASTLSFLSEVMPKTPDNTVEYLTTLNSKIHEALQYEWRDEEGTQTSQETLKRRTGTCRDYAVLLCDIARNQGVAARIASGYVYTRDDEDLSGERSDGATHAWVELYLPGAGWKGFDPTNGVLCGDHFIPVALGPTPESVSPVQGSYCRDIEISHELRVDISVEKLD